MRRNMSTRDTRSPVEGSKRERMHDDPQIGRLLSGRNEPSVLEKEALLERILEEVSPPRRGAPAWLWGLLVPIAACLVLMATRVIEPGTMTREGVEAPEEYASRGGLRQGVLETRCMDEDGASTDCAPGTTLTLNPGAPRGRRYFAAFSVRPDGAVIWYLPAAGARSGRVASRGAVARTLTGVRLGPEHPSGIYMLHGVFSDSPLTRDELRERLGPDLEGRRGLSVVRRPLRIAPGSPR